MHGSLSLRWAQRGGLSALLVCLLALSGCQFFAQSTTQRTSLPPLPKGWSWYHDSAYPFDLPVPTGWKAFGYWNGYAAGDHCVREVDLVPAQWVPNYNKNP